VECGKKKLAGGGKGGGEKQEEPQTGNDWGICDQKGHGGGWWGGGSHGRWKEPKGKEEAGGYKEGKKKLIYRA